MAQKKRRTEHKLRTTPKAQRDLRVLARNIRKWRLVNGWSGERLASSVGCSQDAISHIERCENYPSVCVFIALSRLMGVGDMGLIDPKRKPRKVF